MIFYLILFWLGASLGSFLYVLYKRYDPDKFLLNQEVFFGRSHCPKCHKKLLWFELIPVLSFIIQGGKCRKCGQKIGLDYFFIEILCGLILVALVWHLQNIYFIFFTSQNIFSLKLVWFGLLLILWVLTILSLILAFLIDFKHLILPDELDVFILILAILINILNFSHFKNFNSFSGAYSIIFSFQDNFWINRLIGLAFGFLFFSGLVFITWSKGMGIGDVKLMSILGILFGWPDVLIITIVSFILGGIFSPILIFFKNKTLKSKVPFAPFIVLASLIVIFFAQELLELYFKIAENLINLFAS